MRIKKGQPISKQLSENMRRVLLNSDYGEVAVKHGYKGTTAYQMVCRQVIMNQRNKALLIALLDRAIENANRVGEALIRTRTL